MPSPGHSASARHAPKITRNGATAASTIDDANSRPWCALKNLSTTAPESPLPGVSPPRTANDTITINTPMRPLSGASLPIADPPACVGACISHPFVAPPPPRRQRTRSYGFAAARAGCAPGHGVPPTPLWTDVLAATGTLPERPAGPTRNGLTTLNHVDSIAGLPAESNERGDGMSVDPGTARPAVDA